MTISNETPWALSMIFIGLGLLISSLRGSRERRRWIGTELLLLTPLFPVGATILYAHFWTLFPYAQHLLILPKEAVIQEVNSRHLTPNGTLTFTLPDTQRPEAWLIHIWRENDFPKPDQPTSVSTATTTLSHTAVHEIENLRYDPNDGTYHFYRRVFPTRSD